MKEIRILVGVVFATFTLTQAHAQYSITPLSGFSPNGDGWFAPGEGSYPYLGTGSLERGLAYGNGELYLVSRNGGSFIRRLDPLTGTDLGFLSTAGVVSGGTLAVNMVAVGGDGAIYVGNLTANSSTSPFKVYKWATAASVPIVAYSGDPFGGAARFGDSLTATGSGASTRLAAGSTTLGNGYALINPTAGTGSYVSFTGSSVGDFRLGIDFVDSTHVVGTQGSAVGNGLRYTDTSGTLLGTSTLSTTSQRPIGYTVLGGVPLLAAVDTVDGKLRVYDATSPGSLGSPILFGTAQTFALTANGNATGDIAWGDQFWDGTKWNSYLYAMNSNNGIQAWVISVPEPSAVATALLGGGLLALNFYRRNKQS